MTRSLPEVTRSNPFCTRHVRPGAIAFHFANGDEMAALLAVLAESGFRGEIVGPHGSGKSTLLASLSAALEAEGRTVCHFTLSAGQRRFRAAWRAAAAAADIVLVDGYEQLSWWARVSLRRFCRARGLVVTSHRSTGLRRLVSTAPSAALAWRLVQALYGTAEPLVGRDEVDAACARCGGNLREVFFELYDLHEERARQEGNPRLRQASGLSFGRP